MGTVQTRLLFKRGTKAALEKSLVGENILLKGEPAWEIDTNKLKVGDGVSDYSKLPYVNTGGGSNDQVIFSSRYEFPTEGKSNLLYIATDECKSYIWDQASKRYRTLTSDTINGGNAKSYL